MVQGIHFDDRLSPGDVGWKLVAVNASDVGAMGASPTWAVLSLSLPAPLDRAWVTAFAQGMSEALDAWGIHLVGGDTTGSPGPITASMTMAGTTTQPIGRSGAQPGDTIWVTGTLGDAAAGFLYGTEAGLDALRRPKPPVRFGVALNAAVKVNAMMDLSDGLARDLGRMCRSSGLDADIDPAALPAGPGLTGVTDSLAAQVSFGEDYQLLFATGSDARDAVHRVAELHGVSVHPIGEFGTPKDTPRARLRDTPWPTPGHSHFGGVQ
jgi:thiamine-monophosphate kinase